MNIAFATFLSAPIISTLLYVKPSSKFYYMGVFAVAAIIGVIGYVIILNLNVKNKQ